MSGEPPDDDAPELMKGPTLDASGKVEGRPKLRVVGRPQDELDLSHPPTGNVREGAKSRAAGIVPLAEERLEVRMHDMHSGTLMEKPRSRLLVALLRFLTVLVVVGALGALAYVYRRELRSEVPMLRPKATALVFLSEPDGATVKVGGRVIGKTPVTTQNGWLEGQVVPVEMTLPGYKAWTGTVRGAEDATVEATLKRGK